MLLNRKYINGLTEELERAQETNKDCLKIIEFWRERSNKLKEDIEVKEDTIENLLDANKELSLANTYLEKQNISFAKENAKLERELNQLKTKHSRVTGQLDKLRNYCRQLTGIDILGTGEDE